MAPTVPIEFAGQKESRTCYLSQIMGKSRKYSKGDATGFVPDFRHAVATMAESEGLCCSGRLEMEVAVSEASRGMKRKYPSLNSDGYDSFDVAYQYFTPSKMSRSEKKELELRLKSELEQVRKLQKRVVSLNSNATAMSNDIRSLHEGQKKLAPEGQHTTLKPSAPHGKKRPQPGRNGLKPKTVSGRTEHLKPTVPVNSYAALMKQCESLLNRLLSHQFGWVFEKPVDVVELNIPDYFTVIKHPMDLGTVKSRMTSGKYPSLMDFAADVRLTFSNAITYNPPGNHVHIMAETLSKHFEARWKPIQKKILAMDVGLSSKPSRLATGISGRVPLVKPKRIAKIVSDIKPEPIKRTMTDGEKHKLSKELASLVAELPETTIDFLKEQSYNAGKTNNDEFEIDIDTLCDETLFKLRKLLDDYMLEKRKTKANAGPCEIEPWEYGISNFSIQPCKGNDPMEEDVDIVGGNDPPLPSYPPVLIENDDNINSKSSSSGSSSSGSGSSSSADSDSASSSDSEPDNAKAPEPLNSPKEKVVSGLSVEQKKGDLDNPEAEVVGKVEHSSQNNPVTGESEIHQEGESAPSERQVSPKKVYRAALLRSRFADTILKAREKAFAKGEKQDPEKLILEREKLERQQKEEKARLQAEAKAAEEARRKAEAEAAAEIRRKRELDREAARLALQKMQKTVEINEGSQFLEDLERLSTVDEHFPNFTDEALPHSPQRLGSFKLQGSCNPLEQLGLYMKADDVDIDDEPPQGAAEPVPESYVAEEPANDVEEGEID